MTDAISVQGTAEIGSSWVGKRGVGTAARSGFAHSATMDVTVIDTVAASLRSDVNIIRLCDISLCVSERKASILHCCFIKSGSNLFCNVGPINGDGVAFITELGGRIIAITDYPAKPLSCFNTCQSPCSGLQMLFISSIHLITFLTIL